MTSVLECSPDLSCVQGELKVRFTICSFSFRVVLKPSKRSSYFIISLIFLAQVSVDCTKGKKKAAL